MKKIDITIDLTGRLDLDGPLHIAATAYLPKTAATPARVIFALPGGGYAKDYYDLNFPGHTGYSQAAYHVERGAVFIAMDHLGVGASSTTHLGEMSVETMAKGNHLAVGDLCKKLRDGTLAPGFSAIPRFLTVGIGQSMGGCLTMMMQGPLKTYDAIGVLGYSAIHCVIPMRDKEEMNRIKDAVSFDRTTSFSSASREKLFAGLVDLRYGFFWDDTPEDLVAADFAGGYPMRKTAPAWGSVTVPACSQNMRSPGYLKDEAAAIDVPVFLAFGARDVSENPWAEPAAFPRCRDISLYVLPKMAHMHNFASTREMLWKRLEAWIAIQAAA